MSTFELKWDGDGFLFDAKKITRAAMKMAAFEVEREAKLGMGKGASRPTGKAKRGKRKFHRPSAPGFAPNIDLGILKSSVDTRINNIADNSSRDKEVVGLIGYNIDKVGRKLTAKKGKPKNMKTAVEYGFFLEVGTKNMKPRPWLLPALRRASPEILKIFRKSVS
jgi:hypothetical protein